MKPLHLDDIHYIVTDETHAVSFWTRHFGAQEMAQPLVPFHFIRNLSVKLLEATIVISPVGPYGSSSKKADDAWRARRQIRPRHDLPPHYGVYYVSLKTSHRDARGRFRESGVNILEERCVLPHEPDADAFVIQGPDHNPIAIVRRPEADLYVGSLAKSFSYGIDHIQLLVRDHRETCRFLVDIYSAEFLGSWKNTVKLRVADAILVLSEPEDLGLQRGDVEDRDALNKQRFAVDHLAFLYEDIWPAISSAQDKGYRFNIIQSSDRARTALTEAPPRYRYFGQPSAYTAISILSPDGLGFELVMVDGRAGPMIYYRNPTSTA